MPVVVVSSGVRPHLHLLTGCLITLCTVIDPMGGLIVRINVVFTLDSADSQIKISLAIIAAWGRMSYKQFSLLAGKAAPHEFLQLIIYKASTFAPEIEKLDTVRAYHVRHDQSIFGTL